MLDQLFLYPDSTILFMGGELMESSDRLCNSITLLIQGVYLCLPFLSWFNKQVALWTLGQLVASTGYVVEPYRKYPTLLEVLLNFLKTEQNQGTRREVDGTGPWSAKI